MARPRRFEVRNGLEWICNKLVCMRVGEIRRITTSSTGQVFDINFRSLMYRNVKLLIGKC